MTLKTYLKINPADSVVVCLVDKKKGDIIEADGKQVVLAEDIPAGHKVLISDVKEGEDITTWNLLQLSTEAAKSAYIDRFIDRNQNCTDFAIGIQKAINGNDTEGYSWFLS